MYRFVRSAASSGRKWTYSSEACIGGISAIAASTLLFSTNAQRDDAINDEVKDTDASMISSNTQWLKDQLNIFQQTTKLCQCEALKPDPITRPGVAVRRRHTENILKTLATRVSLSDHFKVFPTPLSDDDLGTVFLAIDRLTKEKSILKLVPKSRLDDVSFLQELEALLRIRQHGGHLHICGLQQNFDNDENNYELIFDFVGGGNLFDHMQKEAYSEEDVASMIRSVVSALDFLHKIGVVHSNLTPGSLMLSSPDASAIVKLVDCSRARVITDDENNGWGLEHSTNAFSPPEAFTMGSSASLKPSMDMWSLGIILYILLTGEHPFHLHDEATDEVLMRRIQSKNPVPLSGFDHTAHLSESALDLLGKLLTTDPEKRITAKAMLNHPWIKGETANKSTIAGLDIRLAQYQEYDSKLNNAGLSVSVDDIAAADGDAKSSQDDPFSEISPVVLENMGSLSFPAGEVIFREGELGSSMFFIKRGSVKLESKDGFTARLGEGDTFGEGSLLHPDKARNATVTCATPAEVIEISREFANKFLARENVNFGVLLKELDSARGVKRAKSIIGQHENYDELELKRSQCLFRKGDEGDAVYFLEHGKIDIIGQGGVVFCLGSGDMFGEESLILGKPRNSSAICTADVCKLKSISAENFHALLNSSPASRDAIHDLTVKRDFQRALALKMKKERRSLSNIEDAFDKTIDSHGTHVISLKEARDMLSNLDTALSEEEITDALHSLDPSESGTIELDEFKRIFVRSRVHDYPLKRRSRSRSQD